MNTTESPLCVLERSDAAMELAHLQAVVCEIGGLVQRSLAERGEVVTLAWLRRIVHRVEHLETAWRNTLPSTPKTTPEQQRRCYDTAHSPRPHQNSGMGMA